MMKIKKAEKKYPAMCGLDCASCEAFIATFNDDNKLREKTARAWTERYRKTGRNRPPVKPGDINCLGCLSNGPVYLHCLKCEIRKCGLNKGVKNCKECKEYRCEMLIKKQSYFLKPKEK